MAITVISSSDNKAKKLWSAALYRDTMAKTYFAKFMGTSPNSIIQLMPETKKSGGDKVTYALLMQLSGAGRTGNQTLSGNEEDLTFYDTSLYIDLMRHAVKVDTTMTMQRTDYDLRRLAREALSDWWARTLDTYMFRYLCGDTSITFAGNTGASADSSHVVYASTCTAESQITTAHLFTLDLIDKAVYKAKTVSPLIRPVNLEGESYYCVVLHPRQAYDLRTNTGTGQWLDIAKAQLQGGKIKDNPLLTGALGIYNGCILYESIYMPRFTTGSGGAYVARALLLGCQAGAVALGRNGDFKNFTWAEELVDYEKNLGVAASLIWGCQKNRFNNQDFGVITIASAAPNL